MAKKAGKKKAAKRRRIDTETRTQIPHHGTSTVVMMARRTPASLMTLMVSSI